ncbi:type VII secretion integral membrane protein EccD [Streptomyces sp. BE308]|uniref:type VII secretion integral membrane protein EccD n=1 Tax=unclassified Streptomyces TaxID=2593676 RepID=UPI002E786B2B|nr:type VII secretion integral membrane protein EccD [Streptomyces sp. BE308]MEE1790678.1 type VII secretion integral membrane protein EccD [Streptomyces sp. BE308]
MTDISAAPLCRLTVLTPDRSVELAVPSDIVLADLMPTIVDHGGTDLYERGAQAGGWVLQRLGQEPLDDENTLGDLGLHDGETVHLRLRGDALPEIHYDDLVDGLSSRLRERPDSWRPVWSHHLMTALALSALATGLLLLLLPGSPGIRAVCAAGTAILLLAGAGAASRAVGDVGAGGALGAAAIPFLAVAGALVPQGAGSDAELGARLLAGCSAAAGAAVLAVAAVGACAPLFLAAALAAVLGAIGGAVMLFGVTPTGAAAPLILAVVLLGHFLPSLAFRLSGLKVPLLPTNAGQLQEGIDPTPDEQIAARGAVADGYLTGLYGATGLVAAGCLTMLAFETSWAPLTLAAVLCALLFTHARGIGGAWQRLAVVLPAAYGAVLLTVLLVLRLDADSRPLLLAGLLAVAAVLAITGWTLPGRRLVPYWGRAVDLLHLLFAIALVPLALLVAGLYSYLRGLNS